MRDCRILLRSGRPTAAEFSALGRQPAPRRASRGAVALALGAALLAGCGEAAGDAGNPSAADSPSTAPTTAPTTDVSPKPATQERQRGLPKATTHTTLRKAPKDPAPFKLSSGRVVHPAQPAVVHSRPGGSPIAILPTKQLRNPTWVPVVDRRQGWARVLLPSRPNRATGWIDTTRADLVTRHTPYVVRVELDSRRLTVTKDGSRLGNWQVAIGASDTPTPKGRTFMLAALAPPEPTYSRLILPLGAHSDTLSTYGGGPGTVGFHTWKDPSVFGKAISHGCVRVPGPALRVLAQVPLGSLVLVTE